MEQVNRANVRDLKTPPEVLPPGDVVRIDQPSLIVARSEFEAAIADARAHPRSIEKARREMLDLCCLNEQTAQECLYALSRDGKVIEGPSIRMAEIIVYCWRNYAVASRIVHEGQDTILVEGAFRDLERGGWIRSEVSRRIVNKAGRRYNVDMIVTTTNAAQAIAKRNAITTGVPRALWWDVYQQTRKVAAGDAKTLATKRADAIKAFQVYGVTPEQIYAKLERAGESEVTRDDLVLLYGLYTAIKDEETTIEEAFPPIETKAASGETKGASSETEPGKSATKGPDLATDAGEQRAAELMAKHGVEKKAPPPWMKRGPAEQLRQATQDAGGVLARDPRVPAGAPQVATPEGDKGPAKPRRQRKGQALE